MGAFALALVFVGAMFASGSVARADTTYYYNVTYVGSWHVGDGPLWSNNPPVYSGQDAAALLFGGSASNYVISTVSSDPNAVNYSAWYDGWGASLSIQPQNYSFDLAPAGYANPGGGGTAYSAYVLDHTCSNRYSNLSFTCPVSDPYINYAFTATVICTTTTGADTCLITSAVPQTVAINGDAGTDTLQVGGATSFSFGANLIGSTYTNFETFQKTGTSNVTLTGTPTSAHNWDIQGGTLTASGGNAINDGPTTSVTVQSGATLALANSETVGNLSGAGNVSLGANTLSINSFGGNLSGQISGSGGVTKLGSFNQTLSGANSYLGTTYIDQGSLILAGGNAIADTGSVDVNLIGTLSLSNSETIGSLTGSGLVSLGANTLTTGGNNASTTFTGQITGSGPLNKAGTGTFTLAGNNSYAGTTTIQDGRLAVQNGAAIADTGLVHLAGVGAVFAVNTSETIGALSGIGSVSLGANILTTGGNNSSTTYSGSIGGLGGLTKNGNGTFTLGGVNSYTGATTISGGVLSVAGSSAISDSSAVSIGAGASLNLANSEAIGSLSGVGSVTLNANTLTAGNNNGTTTYGGSISGTGGLSKGGTGSFTLSGTNSYSGTTNINNGVLVVSGGGAIADAGAVFINSGTFNVATAETIGSLDGAGAVQLGATLTTGGNNISTTYSGSIAGPGGLTKIGTGNLTLRGAGTYAGPTLVSGGILTAHGGAAIADTNNVTVNAPGTFAISNSETIGSLSGTGHLDLFGGSLTTGGGGSTTFSGSSSGANGLNKVGAGTTFSITGAQGYTGLTQVNAGALNVNGSLAGALTVQSGATFSGNATVAGTMTNSGTIAAGNSPGTQNYLGDYVGGGVFDMDVVTNMGGAPVNGTTHDFIDIDGNVSGTTTLNILATGVPVATTGNGFELVRVGGTVASNAFQIAGGYFYYSGFNYFINYLADYSGSDDGFFLKSAAACAVDNNNNVCLIDSNTPQFVPIDALLGADTLQLGGGTNFSFNAGLIGSTYTNFESFNKVGASTVTLTGTGAAGVQWLVQAGTLTASGGNAIHDSASVQVSTGSTFALANNETIGQLNVGGTVDLNGNTLNVTNGLVNFGSGPRNIELDGGTLSVFGTFSQPYTGAINGAGLLINDGLFGELGLTLTAPLNANVLNLDRLILVNSTINGDIDNQDTLYLSGSSVAGDVTGAGLLLQYSGTSYLQGTNTNTGITQVFDGNLILQNGNAIGDTSRVRMQTSGGSPVLTLDASETIGSLEGLVGLVSLGGNTLTTGGNNFTTSFSGAISGTGSMIKTGSGMFTLLGTNTYSGTTTVNGGTLELRSGTAINDLGAVNLNSGTLLVSTSETIGSLSGSGALTLNAGLTTGATSSTTFSGTSLGTGGITKQGAGTTFSITGAQGYTGLTEVNAGTLNVNGSLAGALTVQAGATFSGNATVTGTVTNSGTIAAGNSPGTQNYLGDYVGGGVFDMDVMADQGASPVNGTTHDFIDIDGNVTGTTMLNIFATGSPVATTGDGFELVRVGGTVASNSFQLSGGNFSYGGYYYYLNYLADYTAFDDGFFLKSTYICPVDNNNNTCSIDSTTPTFLAIDALGGFDTLELTGSTSFSFDVALIGTTYTNFEFGEKSGTSTATLTGTATTNNPWTITQGTLVASGGNSIGDGAQVALATFSSAFSLAASETIGDFSGPGSLSLGANTLTLSSGLFYGTSSGSGGIVKYGPGTFEINGAQGYTGTTAINGGLFRMLSGSIAGDLNLAVGTTMSGANSSVAGLVTNLGDIHPQIGSPGGFHFLDDYVGGGSLTMDVLTDQGAAPIDGITHSFIDIEGDVSGLTTINLLPYNLPTVTTGLGFQLVNVGGNVAANAFQLAGGSLTYGGYYYLLFYEQDFSALDDGFFLRTAPICNVDNNANTCLIESTTPLALPIDALLGSDTLQLGGPTNFSFNAGLIGTTFTNFETFEKIDVSNVTLTGTASTAVNWSVLAGTLTASAGNSVFNTSNVAVSSGATFALANAETIGSLSGAGALSLGANTLTTGGNNSSTTWTGTTSGVGGALTKVGTGTFTTGNLGHSGLTTVSQGTMIVNGTVADSVLIQAGATFGGNTTILGSLTNLGTLASGNSPGTTSVGADYFGGGAIAVEVQFDNAGAPVNGITHDFLDIGDDVFGTTLLNIVPFAPSANPAATTGNGIELIRVVDAVTSSQFALSAPVFIGGYQYMLNFVPTAGADSFFLQSRVREEIYGHAALLAAGQMMLNACFRGDERGADVADLARRGRAWAKYTGGNSETGANTGLAMDQDYSCGSGGVDFAHQGNVRLGLSGGFGNSSADVITPSGLATLKGDQGIVEGYAAYAHEKVFMNLSVGYATTDWTFDGSLFGPMSATAEGFVASGQVGMRWPVGALRLALSGAINYDGSSCSEACLFAGVVENVSPWLAKGTLRVDSALSAGRLMPYAAISLADSLDDGNRVALGSAVVSADTASALFAAEAGLTMQVNDRLAFFANASLTEGLDTEVRGYQGQGGFRLLW